MNNIKITIKKELRTIFRDKKTLMVLFLLPIAIPMFIFFYGIMFDNIEEQSNEISLIGVNFKANETEQELAKNNNIELIYYQETKELQDELSKKVGKSRSAVANALRLNNLCDEVKEMLKDGQLTQGHARALLTLNEKTQLNVAQRIIENDLNVRQAEVLARNASEEKKTPSKKTSNPMTQKYYKEIEGSLSSKFGTKVKISEGTKKGKIEIEYYSKDDLERILFELKK